MALLRDSPERWLLPLQPLRPLAAGEKLSEEFVDSCSVAFGCLVYIVRNKNMHPTSSPSCLDESWKDGVPVVNV